MTVSKETEIVLYLLILLLSPFFLYCCFKIRKSKMGELYKKKFDIAKEKNDYQGMKEILSKLIAATLIVIAMPIIVILEILKIIPTLNCVLGGSIIIIALAYFPEIDTFLSGDKKDSP